MTMLHVFKQYTSNGIILTYMCQSSDYRQFVPLDLKIKVHVSCKYSKLICTLVGGGYSIICIFDTNTCFQVYYVCSSLIDRKWSPQIMTMLPLQEPLSKYFDWYHLHVFFNI
jgi:hypothetical protein